MDVEIHPVVPGRWADMVTLFERRGPRGGHRNTPAYGCWCMYWRDRSLEHGEPKKRAMAKLVRGGSEPGLLVYDGERPVGWVAVAPREDFSALMRSPQYRPRDEDRGVWAASALLDAAVSHAFARGAAAVEAYPHVVKGDDYMGGLELYERAGFEKLRAANKRVIVRIVR